MGDEILPSYMGIVINHHEDPYLTTRVQWKGGFLFVAHMAMENSLVSIGNAPPTTNMDTQNDVFF